MSDGAEPTYPPSEPCQANSAADVKLFLSLDLGVHRPVGYAIMAQTEAESQLCRHHKYGSFSVRRS